MLSFAEKLKELRTLKGYTQIELGKKIGVLQGAISGYENGRIEPNFETLENLAKALEVEVADFFPRKGKKSSAQTKGEFEALTKEEKELLRTFRKIEYKQLRDMAKSTIKGFASKMDIFIGEK